ncbi:MAG: prenyltransferase/squalene oxidase repeat-containing protein [Planctomycetota bacterium]
MTDTPHTHDTCPVCGMPQRGLPCDTCYSPRVVEQRDGERRAWMPIDLEKAMATAIAAAAADEARSNVLAAVPATVAAGRNDNNDDANATLVVSWQAAEAIAAANHHNTIDAPADLPEPDLPEPDLVEPELAADVEPEAGLTMLQARGPERAGLPTPNELPAMPDLPEGTRVTPGYFERWRADKAGIPPQELTCQNALLRLLGIRDWRALDAPARAALRIKSKTISGQRLSQDAMRELIFHTFVEVAVEKRKLAEREAAAAELKQGRAWFALAGALHLIVLLAVWSLVMLAFPPKEKKKTLGLAVAAEASPSPWIAPSPSVTPAPPADSPIDRNDPDVPEVDIPDQLQRPDALSMPSDQNRPEPIAPPSLQLPSLPDTKLPGIAPSGSASVASGSPDAANGMLGNRIGGGKRTALRKHGGSAGTENAVNAGLEWLKREQQANGSWLPTDSPTNMRYYAEGYTALAVLCFLGAGHAPNSLSPYRETVQRAIDWLLDRQDRDGLFGQRIMGMGYNQAVSTLALAEAFAMTGDARTRRAVVKALDWLYDAQQPTGGWDYTNNKYQERTDTSITGWVVMAMKSALIGGIDVSRRAWDEAHRAILDLTTDTGEVYYSREGTIYPLRRGTGMAAVGLLCRLYWGEHDGTRSVDGSDRPLVALDKTLKWVTDNPPSADKLRAPNSQWDSMNAAERVNLPSDDEFFHTVYFWYYGTLSLFTYTSGEGQLWLDWNQAMQAAVLPLQHTDESVKRLYGSWDPLHPFWGAYSGRLYATCLNILNLEIYYRYLPLYGHDGRTKMAGRLLADDELRHQRSVRGGSTPNPNPGPRPQNPQDPADTRDLTSVPGAKEALADPVSSGGDRSRSIKTLREDNTADSRAAIAAVLKNPAMSEFTRWEAAKALGELKATDQWGNLRDAYRLSFNKPMRATLLEYMGMLDVPECFDFLLGTMKSSSEKEIREGAAKGLSNLTGKNYGPVPETWEAYRFRAVQEPGPGR